MKPTSKDDGGTRADFKLFLLLFLVVQNSTASLLMREAMTMSSGKWNPQTGVILQELIKALVCTGLVWRETGFRNFRHALALDVESLKTMVPALLYLLQNNMQYIALGHLDAATYTILYQLKILTAAVMTVVILRRSLSWVQWWALSQLTIGASMVIVSQMPTSTAKGDAGVSSFLFGVVAVLIACVASGLAGVYFEKILKGSEKSLWVRNLQLALISLFIGSCSFYYRVDGNDKGFLHGCNLKVLVAVHNNAFGGLLIAFVIKHADTIMKNFATTLSILLTAVISALFLGSDLNSTFVAGSFVVVYAVFLYSGASGLPEAWVFGQKACNLPLDKASSLCPKRSTRKYSDLPPLCDENKDFPLH